MEEASAGEYRDAEVVVGIIGRTFGRFGEVFVEPLNGDPERFSGVRFIAVGAPGRPSSRREIVSARILKGRPVLRFDGVADIGSAETLRHHELRIPESEREQLPEDTFYVDQLVGCRAESLGGDLIGEVSGVEEAGGGLLLVVRRLDGGESLIPFVEGICPSVEPEQRRIRMQLPEGLLGVNG